jgi:hypothetical protein
VSLGSVTRGCGRRQVGAVYAECKLGAGGRPVEDFLVDPPAKVDARALGLSSIGVKLVQTNGVWNVLDIVGGDSYPNVADFVEEVRRFGLSRRLPRTLDFSKLTSESRMILLHRRSYIENHPEFRRAIEAEPCCACPKDRWDHSLQSSTVMCAGLFWEDVDGGTSADSEARVIAEIRQVYRTLPGFGYHGRSRPKDITPSYSLAIFMALPIHNLAVISDPEGGSDEEALQAASHARLEVHLESE